MQLNEVMKELEKNGTAQNRKVYQRHGAGKNLFGVSFAVQTKLKKKIKTDHKLARQLWKTRNADAQTLALLIADSQKLTEKETDTWVKEIEGYYMIASYLGNLVAHTPFAKKKSEQWMKSDQEYSKQAGYDVLSAMLRDGIPVSNSDGEKYLRTIEKEIHNSPNRARHAMNTALIAIGSYMPQVTKQAIEAAKRIGKVEVDHGDTSCKTPDAIPYIEKVLKRNNKKKVRIC